MTIKDSKEANPNKLPSSRYRHAIWHQLQSNQVKGDELKCPRIRKGPYDESSSCSSSESSDDEEKMNSVRVHKKLKSKMENWSKLETVNFSYQDLGHNYQMRNFMRIMRSLKNCKHLQLVDNSLSTLSQVNLSRCETLNVQKNHFKSLNDLPGCGKLKHLNMTENNITSLQGASRFAGLTSLDLSRNPIQYEENYRQKVYKAFPKLKVLDGSPANEDEAENQKEPFLACRIL